MILWLTPLALVVGFLLGRWQASQYLAAASAVQFMTNATVARWNQADAATLQSLDALQRMVKTQGELIAATNRILGDLVQEQRDDRLAHAAPAMPRQVGEPAPWEMSR